MKKSSKLLVGSLIALIAVIVGFKIYEVVVTPKGLNYKFYKQALKIYDLNLDYENKEIGELEYTNRYSKYQKTLLKINVDSDECYNADDTVKYLDTWRHYLLQSEDYDSFIIQEGKMIDEKADNIKECKEQLALILNK